jgi:hypothetical protein
MAIYIEPVDCLCQRFFRVVTEAEYCLRLESKLVFGLPELELSW